MLFQRIETEMKTALRAKDHIKLDALRLLKSAVNYYLLEKGVKEGPASDADVVTVVQKQIKQRRDSIESYEKAGRTDLAQKEKIELAVLETYLPQQLSQDELLALVKASIAEVGATSKAQMGTVMKILMPKVAGKADGKLVSQMVQQNLS
jgi:uncharacterized protein YqeY